MVRVFFFLFSFSFLYSQSSIEKELEKHITYNPEGKNLIGYLSLEKDRPIDQSTFIRFKFAFDEFRKQKVVFVLLRLNTPGGQVFSAQKICRLMQELDSQYKIPIVCFIDNWAISAGAMLAYSSRFIVTTSQSSMGAAEPVIVSQEGSQTASEKVNSALRSEFSNLASFYNRSPLLAQAMVDKSMVLVERGNTIVSLTSDKQILTSDKVITREGKLLTLDAKQLVEFSVSDFQVPFVEAFSMQKDKMPFEKTPIYSYPFFSKMQKAQLITYKDWKVSFFSFLSHPMIASLLVMGLIIGFYIELTTPGFGVFGIIGLSCLSLILLSSFSIYAVNWLEIILLLVGMALILLEIFIIPGFGISGVLGALLFVIGLFSLMIPSIKGINFSFDFDQWNLQTLDVLRHLAWFSLAFILSFVFILLLSRYLLPKKFFYSLFISKGSQEKILGYTSGPVEGSLPKVGQEGIVIASLRPSGKVEIHDMVYDAIAERGYIDKDEKIQVVTVQAKRLIVRKK